jgi:chemotaxis protein methyltransferase WspC
MNLSPVEDLVRARIGLDPLSLGATTFPRTVEARMRARAVESAVAYAGVLNTVPSEWATLVEDLVVPESWFFRGGASYFAQLARWLRERAAHRQVRVLSVPCGSGEEPYSLAMALDEDGVPPGSIRIEGIDLSPGSVRRCEAGLYPTFAFRETSVDPRPHYFRDAGQGRWELHRQIRDAVRFRPGNLVSPDFLYGEPPFDLILCRNLFIYLTDEARGRAVANIHRLLAPGGRLCLTAAEADRLPPGQFTPDGPPALAVFLRSGEPAGPPRSGLISRTPSAPPRSGAIPRPAPVPVTVPVPVNTDTHTGTHVDAPVAIAVARSWADSGRMEEARAACERAVRAAPTAEWYSLLGVIELATGHSANAEAAFGRALYLDPDHRESLTHLAMLCERRGDPGPASGLRRRLSRLPEATA